MKTLLPLLLLVLVHSHSWTMRRIRRDAQERLDHKAHHLKHKGLDGEDVLTDKPTKRLDRYFYRELRINMANYHEKDIDGDDQRTETLQDKVEYKEEPAKVENEAKAQCVVELKKERKTEEEEEDGRETNKQIEENDVCECNVKCIDQCQNIQLGTEGLPVIYLETNKYMIEINEQAHVSCEQSCHDNLHQLGCEVRPKE